MIRDSERARAKVNLTLRVLGKRPDGFHEIESLAAFADVCDVVEFTHAAQDALTLSGPFAGQLADDDNLVLRALNLFRKSFADTPRVELRLRKEIPVAAGLGGGSADAAAALRLFARTADAGGASQALQSIAAQLGSDVPVCLDSRAAVIRGRGEKIDHLESFPALPVVLVNPGIALKTPEVYAALSADQVNGTQETGMPDLSTRDEVVRYMSDNGNDLEAAAVRLQPTIADVLKTISDCEGCLVSRMSGSGSTCFGVFASGSCADEAAGKIAGLRPGWWARKTFLS